MRSATMSAAQLNRFIDDADMQDALYQRRESFLWELLAHATGGAIREAITALGPSASAYARVKEVFKSYRSLATHKKTMLDAEWDHPEGKCFNMNPGIDITAYCDRCRPLVGLLCPLLGGTVPFFV